MGTVSARIVQFAKEHGASILVFEHLGTLKPQKGKYSHRSNAKRAYWMKGRIFNYAKYKAWQEGIITSRVSPRNTSRECAHCHGLIARYDAKHVPEGYTPGTPLVFCSHCGMKGNADRNASLISQRLLARFQKQHQPLQGKPCTPLSETESVRNHQVWPVPKTPRVEVGHLPAAHEGMERPTGMAPPTRNAQGWWRTPPLFLANYVCSVSRGYASFLEQATTQEYKKPPSHRGCAECH